MLKEGVSFRDSTGTTFCSLAAIASASSSQTAYTEDTSLPCSDPEIPDPKRTYVTHNPASP